MIRLAVARAASLSSALLLFGLPSLSLADDYLPLDIRNHWVYSHVSEPNRSVEVTITGTQMVIGVETLVWHRIEYLPGGDTVIDDAFLSKSPEGDVYYHGRAIGSSVSVYDPPILWFDAPPVVGNSWSTTSQVYSDFEGQIPVGSPVTIAYQILDQDLVTTPAGTFPAYELGTGTPAAPLWPSELDAGRGGEISLAWLASGIGMVRIGFQWELTEFGGPLAVEDGTWARVKAMYR
jgi:hypothetical protein